MYGGTKEEMQRLIQEASKMKDVQAELGVTVDANSMSFGNIVDAISVVQKNMGIMGTTAAEAEKTISGSVSSMKAAWSNLLTGFGRDNANLTRLIHQFANSAMTAADNILPRVEVILNGIAKALPKFISLISQRLPGMLESLQPPLIEAAAALFTGLVSALPTLLKIILDQAPFILSQIGLALKNAFPQLLLVLKELIVQAWDFVSLELLNTGVEFTEAWAVISEKISSAFESVWSVCQWVWSNYGQPIWDMVSLAVTELWGLFQKNMPAIKKFFQDAMAGIKDTWNNHLMPVFQAISDALNNVVKPAFEFVFKTIIEPLVTNVFDTIRRLWHGTLKPIFDGIVDYLLGVFTGDWDKAFQGILNIVTGIFNAIVLAIEKPMDLAKDIVFKAIEFIKDKFNFDWKLPDLKLPHFTISGSFSLNPLSVPSFGIEWYKKAMDNPMIMEQPTAFGINSLGQIMAGGEAGSEVVSGTDTLMNLIASAMAAQNGALVAVLYRILDAIIAMDENMGGNLREALDGTAFEMNNREFARLVKAVN